MGCVGKRGECEMEREELRMVLDLHEKWVRKESGGIRADLRDVNLQGADLRDVNLQGADLRDVNLRGADLWDVDLRGADLWDVDLQGAHLQGANLRGANLRGADLWDVDLRGADLRDADLRGADIDYAAWPLWCRSLDAYIDDRIAIQLLYHLLRPVQASPYVSQEVKERLMTDDLIDLANRFHRVEECGEIEK